MKLFEYFFSAVNVVSSNPCVVPSPGIKMSFFLLSTSTEELASTPKIITFLPNTPVGNEKVPFVSNPIPYPEYLSQPFFTNLAAPNKKFPSVESLLST